jgi:hypothetical protein
MTTRRARAPSTRPAKRAATRPRAFRPPLVLRRFARGAPPPRSAARSTRETNRSCDPLPRARGGPGRGTNRSSSSRFTCNAPEHWAAVQRARHQKAEASPGSCGRSSTSQVRRRAAETHVQTIVATHARAVALYLAFPLIPVVGRTLRRFLASFQLEIRCTWARYGEHIPSAPVLWMLRSSLHDHGVLRMHRGTAFPRTNSIDSGPK